MKRIIAILLPQAVLLGIEIGTTYDTGVRQAVLALTNLGATVGLLWLDASLRRRGAQLSLVTIIVVLGAVWFDALGNFQHLYARYWWYDRLTHSTGGLAVSALFINLALVRRMLAKINVTTTLAIGFGFLLGQFVAAIYEITEWLGDWWFGTERVRGLFDAPRDLFFNLVGGLLVVLIFWATRSKKNSQGG